MYRYLSLKLFKFFVVEFQAAREKLHKRHLNFLFDQLEGFEPI